MLSFFAIRITWVLVKYKNCVKFNQKYISLFFCAIVITVSCYLLFSPERAISTSANMHIEKPKNSLINCQLDFILSILKKKRPELVALDKQSEQENLQIYNDSLVNGWIDYGWAALNYHNTTAKQSGNNSISITAKAYEGIYLHHAALETSNYYELSFWIYGDDFGGENLLVGATLSGKEQLLYKMPPLKAKVWQQIKIPLNLLGVSKKPNFDGIFIKDNSGTSSPTYYLDNIYLTTVSAPNIVRINVDASKIQRSVDNRLFGMNSGAWESAFTSPENIQILKEIDNRVLRFPGGSLSDIYHWQTKQTIQDGQITTQPLSFDDFAASTVKAQNQAFITVNYGSGTPDEAAEWVKYSNQTKKYNLKFWEIGNECYGESEYDTNSRPHDPYTYALRAKQYITKMKAQDPKIKVGVVVTTGEDEYDKYTDHPAKNPRTNQIHYGWTPVSLSTLKNLGVIPDFVIYHKYNNAPWKENDATLLQSTASWKTDIGNIRQMLSDYLGQESSKVEIVATEHNSTWMPPTGKQMTSLVNGLFFADSMGQALQTELKGLVWWLLRSTPETDGNLDSSLYGWRQHGGYGIISHENTNYKKYPTFYAAKLLSKFVRGGDKIIKTTSNYAMVSAYAAKKVDGKLSLLIINKSPNNTFQADVNIVGYSPSGNAKVYSYGIPQDLAAKTLTGSPDIEQDEIYNLDSTFNIKLAPYSAMVLSFDQLNNTKNTTIYAY